MRYQTLIPEVKLAWRSISEGLHGFNSPSLDWHDTKVFFRQNLVWRDQNLCQEHDYTTSATQMGPHPSQSVTWTVTSSLDSYQILFSTCISYSYTSGKFKHTYTGIPFHEVVCTRLNIPWCGELADVCNETIFVNQYIKIIHKINYRYHTIGNSSYHLLSIINQM
jgi:hypothetical protein